ncbi:MAG: hypothetical protein COB93_10490 [Sneathiella sp.]|nr:MAG: hypothetical protein COB93_10490 [Sneathiella sp.]
MKKNVGISDRIIRVVLGLGLLAMALFASELSYSWIGWVGVVPLVTGLAGKCPLYGLLGLNTCKVV